MIIIQLLLHSNPIIFVAIRFDCCRKPGAILPDLKLLHPP